MFNLVRQTLPFQESQLLKNVKKSLISQIPTMSLKRFLLSKKMRQELTNKPVILLKNL